MVHLQSNELCHRNPSLDSLGSSSQRQVMATPQCCSSWWISRFPQSKPLTGAGLWLATGTASATENMSGFKTRWFTVSLRRTPTSAMRQCHYRITVPSILTVPKKLLANTEWDYCTHENPKCGNHSKWLLDIRKRCNGLEGHCIPCRPIYCLPTAPVCPCGPFILSHQAGVGQQQEPICSSIWEMWWNGLDSIDSPRKGSRFHESTQNPSKKIERPLSIPNVAWPRSFCFSIYMCMVE